MVVDGRVGVTRGQATHDWQHDQRDHYAADADVAELVEQADIDGQRLHRTACSDSPEAADTKEEGSRLDTFVTILNLLTKYERQPVPGTEEQRQKLDRMINAARWPASERPASQNDSTSDDAQEPSAAAAPVPTPALDAFNAATPILPAPQAAASLRAAAPFIKNNIQGSFGPTAAATPLSGPPLKQRSSMEAHTQPSAIPASWVMNSGPTAPSSSLDCPLCSTTFSADIIPQQPLMLACGHSVCRACVSRLPHKACPTCRAPFSNALLNHTVCEALKTIPARRQSLAAPLLAPGLQSGNTNNTAHNQYTHTHTNNGFNHHHHPTTNNNGFHNSSSNNNNNNGFNNSGNNHNNNNHNNNNGFNNNNHNNNNHNNNHSSSYHSNSSNTNGRPAGDAAHTLQEMFQLALSHAPSAFAAGPTGLAGAQLNPSLLLQQLPAALSSVAQFPVPSTRLPADCAAAVGGTAGGNASRPAFTAAGPAASSSGSHCTGGSTAVSRPVVTAVPARGMAEILEELGRKPHGNTQLRPSSQHSAIAPLPRSHQPPTEPNSLGHTQAVTAVPAPIHTAFSAFSSRVEPQKPTLPSVPKVPAAVSATETAMTDTTESDSLPQSPEHQTAASGRLNDCPAAANAGAGAMPVRPLPRPASSCVSQNRGPAGGQPQQAPHCAQDGSTLEHTQSAEPLLRSQPQQGVSGGLQQQRQPLNGSELCQPHELPPSHREQRSPQHTASQQQPQQPEDRRRTSLSSSLQQQEQPGTPPLDGPDPGIGPEALTQQQRSSRKQQQQQQQQSAADHPHSERAVSLGEQAPASRPLPVPPQHRRSGRRVAARGACRPGKRAGAAAAAAQTVTAAGPEWQAASQRAAAAAAAAAAREGPPPPSRQPQATAEQDDGQSVVKTRSTSSRSQDMEPAAPAVGGRQSGPDSGRWDEVRRGSRPAGGRPTHSGGCAAAASVTPPTASQHRDAALEPASKRARVQDAGGAHSQQQRGRAASTAPGPARMTAGQQPPRPALSSHTAGSRPPVSHNQGRGGLKGRSSPAEGTGDSESDSDHEESHYN
ncbi:MAG: hypothetical protein WDW38_003439 [Sanguina aurantia]